MPIAHLVKEGLFGLHSVDPLHLYSHSHKQVKYKYKFSRNCGLFLDCTVVVV